jgi:hypothetical protein
VCSTRENRTCVWMCLCEDERVRERMRACVCGCCDCLRIHARACIGRREVSSPGAAGSSYPYSRWSPAVYPGCLPPHPQWLRYSRAGCSSGTQTAVGTPPAVHTSAMVSLRSGPAEIALTDIKASYGARSARELLAPPPVHLGDTLHRLHSVSPPVTTRLHQREFFVRVT